MTQTPAQPPQRDPKRRRRRQDPYQAPAKPSRSLRMATLLVRVLLVLVVVAGCGTAVFVLYGRWLGSGASIVQSGSGNPALNPAEQLYLQNYLSTRSDELQQPAGVGNTAVAFTVSPGESANQIADNLLASNLIRNRELFINYLRYNGLDAQLEAGDFFLSPQSTVPELARQLTNAVAQEVTVRFVEGWRLEEMADLLREAPVAQINADQFLAIAQRQQPFDVTPYLFLASLPPEATLEGFLFPDTYRLPLDADAAYLIDLMLRNFGNRVTPSMRQAFGAQGLSLYEAVTLASIVEREAVVAEERPLIAGVFYNRLAVGMKLEADPTVQYPLGYQPTTDSWWKKGLTVADLQAANGYNTYVIEGLPVGPIANPGLSSLQAVANPEPSDFIFFVAECETAVVGTHAFSITYDEHLANVNRCR